jgi:hypothetical protein
MIVHIHAPQGILNLLPPAFPVVGELITGMGHKAFYDAVTIAQNKLPEGNQRNVWQRARIIFSSEKGERRCHQSSHSMYPDLQVVDTPTDIRYCVQWLRPVVLVVDNDRLHLGANQLLPCQVCEWEAGIDDIPL